LKKRYKLLIGIVVFIGLLWLALELFAGSFIRSSLQRSVQYYPSDTLAIGQVNVTYFPLGLELRDLDFDLHQPADTLMISWRGKLEVARAKGLNWLGALQGKDLRLELLEVGEGAIQWNISPRQKQKKRQDPSSSGKPERHKLLLEKLRIEQLDLGLERDSSSIGLSVALEIDSLWLNNKDSLRWQLGRLRMHSENGDFRNVMRDYNFSYQSLHFDSADSVLNMRGFRMKPGLSRSGFYEKYTYMKVQPDISADLIQMEGIDVARVNEGIFARVLLIDSTLIDIYQDTRKERRPGRVKLPSELLAKAPLAIDVDSLVLKRGKLIYHERVDKQEELAFLEGDELELSIFPLSNRGDTVSSDMDMKASIRFMKEAKTTLNAHFYKGKPSHDFKVEATMGAVNMARFNPILLPMTGIYIKSGDCREIRVSMYGNDYTCKGDMNIAYHDLKIAIPANDEERNFFEKIAEGLGNLALVNTNNDFSDDNGLIYYERDLRRPVVNYWWKSMETGLKDVLIRFHKNKDGS